jgi:hypothetical protein
MAKPNPITKVTAENCAEVVADLKTFIAEGMLPARDHQFANDLISGKYGFEKRGYLSEGQMGWIGVLTDRALGLEIVPTTTEVGNLEGLVQLFEDALEKSKRPKIVLTSCDQKIKLTIAGPKSKYHGCIMITDGGPYGDNQWFGTVNPQDGTWLPSKSTTEDQITIIKRVLEAFANNPHKAAMTYGKQQHSCCFCAKALDTKESVTAGYGPVCADKWGLPWGHTS